MVPSLHGPLEQGPIIIRSPHTPYSSYLTGTILQVVVNDLGGNTTGSGSSSSAAAGALAFKSAAKHAWKRVSQKGVLQASHLGSPDCLASREQPC